VTSSAAAPFVTALRSSRAVAIVRGRYSVDEYREITGTLREAGFTAIEFTMEQPNALAAVRTLLSEESSQWLGAGTVRSADDARKALEAGARFLVSPGFVAAVARLAQGANVPYLPGVLTPSEVEAAVGAGCHTVKLFPAGSLGPEYLRAITAPLTGVEFVPTGGIGLADASSYLAAGAIAVGLGSSLVGKGDDRAQLLERARKFRQALGAYADHA
jgi:2-dehydro-3-deoxyphosphogluconate aldolase/(4S)-4-hydroxy-2-oxoglutarate aldolase